MDMIYKDECYAIRGAVYEVYKILGTGFAEGVYQEALESELKARNIPFESQKPIIVMYKGQPLGCHYKADIVCYGKIILELKAVKTLLPEHMAQLLNYLKATSMRLGFLINFWGHPHVDVKTYAN